MNAADRPLKDPSQLRARRARARRRRSLLRLDIAFGVLVAIVMLIAASGLAIVAIVAFILLGLCGLSIVVERRLARRSQPPRRRLR